MIAIPRTKPINGERNRKASTGIQPPQRMTPIPDLVIAAPATPPKRACDDEVGSARIQVMMFQTTAPSSPPKTT